MRRDAKRVKDINGLTQILIDLKPYRCDSDVYINEDVDVTELVKYIEKKKSKNKDITFFMLLLLRWVKQFIIEIN